MMENTEIDYAAVIQHYRDYLDTAKAMDYVNEQSAAQFKEFIEEVISHTERFITRHKLYVNLSFLHRDNSKIIMNDRRFGEKTRVGQYAELRSNQIEELEKLVNWAERLADSKKDNQ